MHADLFWHADTRPGVRISTASSYVAPTWSWASGSGIVDWYVGGSFLAEILGVHCSPSGSDELGMITSGELVLRAKTIPVRLTKEFFHLRSEKFWTITIESRDPATGEQACLGPFRPDCIQPTPEAEFYDDAMTKPSWPGYSPKKMIPAGDGEYLAVLLGTLAVVIIRIVEAGDVIVCERVGAVLPDILRDCDVNTRWFDGAESQII
ncbi:hypothetical protein ACHAPT_005416 [Fusarium lateritium]